MQRVQQDTSREHIKLLRHKADIKLLRHKADGSLKGSTSRAGASVGVLHFLSWHFAGNPEDKRFAGGADSAEITGLPSGTMVPSHKPFRLRPGKLESRSDCTCLDTRSGDLRGILQVVLKPSFGQCQGPRIQACRRHLFGVSYVAKGRSCCSCCHLCHIASSSTSFSKSSYGQQALPWPLSGFEKHAQEATVIADSKPPNHSRIPIDCAAEGCCRPALPSAGPHMT